MSEVTNILLTQRKFNVDANDYLLSITETQDYKISEKYQELHYDDVESIFKFHLKFPIMSVKYSIDGNPWINAAKTPSLNYESNVATGKQILLVTPMTNDIYMIRLRLATNIKLFQVQFNYFGEFDITDHLSFRLPITLVPCYHKSKVTKSDIITSIIENTDQAREKMKKTLEVIDECDKTEEEKAMYREMCIANYKTALVNNKKMCLFPMYLPQFNKHVDFEPFVSYSIVVDVHLENSNLFLFHAIVNNNLANKTMVPNQLNPGDKHILNTSFNLSGRDDVLFRLYIDIEKIKPVVYVDPNNYCQYVIPPIVKNIKEEKENKYIFVTTCSATMTTYSSYLANIILKMCIRYLKEGTTFDIVFIGENERRLTHTITATNVHPNTSCMNCNASPITGTKYTLKGTSITMCDKCYGKLQDNSNWVANDNKSILRDYEKEIDSQAISMGENSLYLTLKNLDNNRDKLILITDASISDIDEKKIMKLLNNKMDVFAFGVGNGHKESFLDRISRLNNGCTKHIFDKKDIVYNVDHLMKCATGKCIKNNITTTSLTANLPLDCLFEGESVILYGKMEDNDIPEEVQRETTMCDLSIVHQSVIGNRMVYSAIINDDIVDQRSYLLLESPLAIPELSSYDTNMVDMNYENLV